MSERLALAGRIRASLEDVRMTINRAIMLAEKGIAAATLIIGMGWR